MNKRTTARILKKAIKLVEHGWCQGNYAETKDGIQCNEMDKTADRFCASGALKRASSGMDYDTQNNVRSHVSKYIPNNKGGFPIIVTFNDKKTTKKADVLKVFKRALKPLVNA